MSQNTIMKRMKEAYERPYRVQLPRFTNTIIRVDGVAFHTLTKGMKLPFDVGFRDAMEEAAYALCKTFHNAMCAFVQSDEISIWLADYKTINTHYDSGGNLQKLCSKSASLAGVVFADKIKRAYSELPTIPYFDARVFVIPQLVEVANYFIARQQDATRNSINTHAQVHLTQDKLNGMSTNKMQDYLFTEHGMNWNDCPAFEKRGTLIEHQGPGWVVNRLTPKFNVTNFLERFAQRTSSEFDKE